MIFMSILACEEIARLKTFVADLGVKNHRLAEELAAAQTRVGHVVELGKSADVSETTTPRVVLEG